MNGKKAKYFVREYTERPVSKKEFLRVQKEEFEKEHVARAHLVREKVFSESEIRKYEKAGELIPVLFRGKKFFKKDEVAELLD